MHVTKKYVAAVLALALMALVVTLFTAAPTALAQQTGSNWLAFYWNNTNFSGTPAFSRVDPVVNFNWATNSPVPGVVNPDNFSARWSNKIFFSAGTYRFRAGADDGIRVAINGNLIINRFTAAVNGFEQTYADVQLAQGDYEIVIDYYEGVGNAGVLFDWSISTGVQPTLPFGVTPTFGPGSVIAPTAIPPMKGVVIVRTANVRSGPAISYPTIAQLPLDQVVIIAARNGEFGFETWFLVNMPSGGQGWMSRSVLYPYNSDPAYLPKSNIIIDAPAIAPAGETAPGAPPAVGTYEVLGVARNNAMLRDGPSAYTGKKIGVLDKGTGFRMLVLSTNQAWVYVDANGVRGWTYVPNVTLTVGSYSLLPRGNSAP